MIVLPWIRIQIEPKSWIRIQIQCVLIYNTDIFCFVWSLMQIEDLDPHYKILRIHITAKKYSSKFEWGYYKRQNKYGINLITVLEYSVAKKNR